MFTWVNKKTVESSDGFVVQFTGRFSAEYQENGKIITLDIENGSYGGKPCVLLDPEAFQHWDSESTLLPDTEQERLFNNFRDACEFQGLKMLVQKGEGPPPGAKVISWDF